MIGRSGIRSLTIGDNLITLCTKCHKNVHHGHLKITGTAPHFCCLSSEDLQPEVLWGFAPLSLIRAWPGGFDWSICMIDLATAVFVPAC